MPELPDVEVYKNFVNDLASNHEIESIDILDSQVIKVSQSNLKKALINHTLGKARRLGKYLFVELGSEQYLTMHFGMTGELRYYEKAQDLPDYTQLVLNFKGGGHMAYVSRRKLGKIMLTDSVTSFQKDKNLGPDALDIPFGEFKALIGSHTGMIKPVLLNQSIISGIGNVYSDEILFHSKVHPKKHIQDFSEMDFETIYHYLQKVLRESIENNATPEKMPEGYLIPLREEGESCPKCGGQIEKATVGARPTYFCPACQKM